MGLSSILLHALREYISPRMEVDARCNYLANMAKVVVFDAVAYMLG